MSIRPMRLCALLTAVPLLASTAATWAQVGGADLDAMLNLQPSRATGLAAFLTRVDGTPFTIRIQREVGETTAHVFLREYGHHFGLVDPDAQLRVTRVETDRLGYVHTTHQQVHVGVPVFSGVVKVHERPDGAVHAANGDFYPLAPKLGVVPTRSLDEALAVARRSAGRADATVERNEMIIVDPGWYGESFTGAQLAYHVVLTDGIGYRQAFFVDAHTGEIIDTWSMIHHARDRAIHDGMELPALPGLFARGEGDLPVVDADIDAAYDFYGDTYDYFFRAFGRDSIDGNGMTMIATTHSTAPGCPNASWNGSQMIFCTGTVTDDIVGHELAHGVTEFTADLIYRNQPGQLNESFSDVFGELIDLFNGDAAFAGAPGGMPWPTHATGPGVDEPNNLRSVCSLNPSNPDGVRWLIGEDAAAFGGSIRDMWSPPCRNSPDFANSVLQLCQATDNGGVHRGSGVPNHAFAMLTDGKSFNGRTVVGIGPIKAGAVWYRALTVYLSAASDFADAYAAFNLAAQDLVGTFPADPRTGLPGLDLFTAFDAQQVDEALLAVEMNTPGACGAVDPILLATAPTFCDGAQVVLAETFETGAPGWTVSNTAMITPYDWELRSGDLPNNHAGTVWYVADPSLGDCGLQDEVGVHSLISPTLALPDVAGVYQIAFTHLVSTEGAWDGGNVKIQVNGGSFQEIPRSAFEHNPYNGALRTVASGNSNPMAGQTAFTGSGDEWGASVISLAGIASGGDDLAIRFDLGKDGCVGVDGWYVDDFLILRCPDADDDGTSDHRDVVYIDASEPIYVVGVGVVTSTTFTAPRRAAGDVVLSFTAYADLAATNEFIDVSVNGAFVDRLFEVSGVDCSAWPHRAEVVVPAATFNNLQMTSQIEVACQGSAEVGPNLCGNANYVTVAMTYVQTTFGDINGDGVVGIQDFLDVLGAWGPCLHCLEDFNGDGVVGVDEFLAVLGNWTG